MSNTHDKYYDGRTDRNILSFLKGNARISAAWHTIFKCADHALSPKKIVDFGCGIGESSWRASLAWSHAEIHGIDPSEGSISVAKKLFPEPNLNFHRGSIEVLSKIQDCDLFFMIDVIEHISPADYDRLFLAIRKLLSPISVVVLTFPLPGHLEYLRLNNPSEIQPIDEDIDLQFLQKFAIGTDTTLTRFEFKSIWSENDYAHALFQKIPPFTKGKKKLSKPSLKDKVLNKLKAESTPDNKTMRKRVLAKSGLSP